MIKINFKKLSVGLLLCLSLNAFSTDYFISNSGENSASGTSQSSAWETINKLNTFTLSSGDRVFFERGGIYYGSLNIETSGITIGAYGSGDKPVISGYVQLTGWVNRGNNIWKTAAPSNNVKFLVRDGQSQTLGRYPNEQWLNYETAVGGTGIIDNQLGAPTGYWTGGECVVYSSNWTLDAMKIESQTPSEIAFTEGVTYALSGGLAEGKEYFIQNHPNALDINGEWANMLDSIFLYSTTDPNSSIIKVSSLENGIKASASQVVDNLIVDGVRIEGYNNNAIDIRINAGGSGSNISITNNEFANIGNMAVQSMYANNLTVANNTFDNILNNGVFNEFCDVTNITDNVFNDIGMEFGRGATGNGAYTGIMHVFGSNHVVSRNRLTNVGYLAISSEVAPDPVITENIIDGACLIKTDGGGIYAWQRTLGLYTGGLIERNVISNVKGSVRNIEGTEHTRNDVFAIYIDDDNLNMNIEQNIITNSEVAVFIHNSQNIDLQNNTIYNCNSGIFFRAGGGGGDTDLINDCDINGNKLVYLGSSISDIYSENMLCLKWNRDASPNYPITENNSLDGNYYIMPFTTDNGICYSDSYDDFVNSLSSWKETNFGTVTSPIYHDENSFEEPIKWSAASGIEASNFVFFDYATYTVKTISLIDNYLDINGNVVSGSITLQPFESIILFKTDENYDISGSVPTDLATVAVTQSNVDLTWRSAVGSVGVVGYEIYCDGTLIGTSATTSYSDNTVAASTSYSYQVLAYDASNSRSGLSSALEVTTSDTAASEPDLDIADAVPTSLSASSISSSSVSLAWQTAIGDYGVVGFEVYRDGAFIGTSTTSSYVDNTVSASTSYSYQVLAYDAADNKSGLSNALSVATRNAEAPAPAPVIDIADAIPTNLSASSISSSSVSLTWQAAIGEYDIIGFQVYRDGIFIGTTTATNTSYTDDTASASTTYLYEVLAYDAADNKSGLSDALYVVTSHDEASAPAPDIVDAIPTRLTAEFVSNSSVSLTWQAAVGDYSTIGFQVYRDGTFIGTTTITSYVDNTVAASTAYSYQVLAYDAADNKSGLSNALSVVTHNAQVPDPDIADAIPINLSASSISSSSVGLTWEAAVGDYGTIGFQVYRDGAFIGITTTTSYVDNTVAASTTYSYQVLAYDAADNKSGLSNSLSLVTHNTPAAILDIADAIPTNLSAVSISSSSVSLTWQAAVGNYDMIGFQIYRDGIFIGTTTASTTSYTDDTASASTTYLYEVLAYDAADNKSGLSDALSVLTHDAPGSDPDILDAIPTNLSASSISYSSVSLTWEAAVGDYSMIGFQVYRDGAFIGTTSTTSYTDNTVSASTSYSYEVLAYDEADNKSGLSSALSVVTRNAPIQDFDISDAIPTSLSAEFISYSRVGITWQAATGDYNVTGFQIYRDGTFIGTTTATSYTDNSVSASTPYSYQVLAFDAADNKSVLSDALSIVTHDAPAPVLNIADAIPTNLSAVSISSSSVSLTWEAAIGDYRMDGFQVYRDGTYIGTTSTTSYTDDTATASTKYSYQVLAYDAADYKSGLSDALIVVTPEALGSEPDIADAIPTSLSTEFVSSSSVGLTWEAAVGDYGVIGFQVYRDGTFIGTTPTTSYTDDTASASTTYLYEVLAYDAADNKSGLSDALSVVTENAANPDLDIADAIPTNLSAEFISSSSVSLTWQAAVGDYGVIGFQVYRDGTFIGTTPTTRYTDDTASASTTYLYEVLAYDLADNKSGLSNGLVVKTLALYSNNRVDKTPVIIVDNDDMAYSGFQKTLDASGSFDPEGKSLTFKWIVPSDVSVASTNEETLRFLAPDVIESESREFELIVSDGTKTVSRKISIEMVPFKPTVEEIAVMSIETSNYDSNNYPKNVLDGSSDTYWSATGMNEWISLELETPVTPSYLKVSYFNGEHRKAKFDLFASNDNENFVQLESTLESCGFSSKAHVHPLLDTKAAETYKYIKLVGYGSDVDQNNALSEIKIYGLKSASSANELRLEDNVEVFPNPARISFNVKLENESQVRVLDLSGRVVMDEVMQPGVNEVLVTFPHGNYILQVICNNKALTKSLIIR